MQPRLFGIVGWSGSGKTTLITRLIPLLVDTGLRVATIKHAHHAFDIDHPGKDSFEHRKAGACEVIVSSSNRWAQIHENNDGREATLGELVARLTPCDLVLVEGFKGGTHPRLEVFRPSVGKAPLYPHDKGIVAVATDQTSVHTQIPVLDLNDIAAIAACAMSCAISGDQSAARSAVEDASMVTSGRSSRPSYEF